MKATVETKKLKELICSVSKGLSKELFRPSFTGIRMEAKDNRLTVTTCDGYKLFTNSCEAKEIEPFEVTIPIFSIPKQVEQETTITINGEWVEINFGDRKICLKTIKGDFIDWKQLFNRENKFSIWLNPKYLKEALNGFNDYVELSFKDDTDSIIIHDVINCENKRLVLPVRKRV